MNEKDKLLEVIIPDYIKRIETAKARRPKYFEKDKTKLADKYKNKIGTLYSWTMVKGKLLLHDINGELVLANPKACGTPRYMNINSNHIYAGYSSPHQRALIVNSIKASFTKYFKGKKITEFPIIFKMDVYDKYAEQNSAEAKKSQDLDNAVGLYSKCTLDLMTKLKVIPDDNLKYVREINYEFIESETRKLVITCYKYKPKLETKNLKKIKNIEMAMGNYSYRLININNIK